MEKLSGIWIVFVIAIVFNLTFAHVAFSGMVIDGKIGDLEWQDAQEFTFSAENPDFDITALVKWDTEYFYFACIIEDPEVVGKHEEDIQNVWEDDDVEFYLETDNKKRNGRSVNSYQLLFSAAGAYNDTVGDGVTFVFAWDSDVEYVVALLDGTTINDGKDTDPGWSVESRLPWEDMDVNGQEVEGETMGWNILVADYPAANVFNWSDKVDGWNNNHSCSNWGEITFDEGRVAVEPQDSLPITWGRIKLMK